MRRRLPTPLAASLVCFLVGACAQTETNAPKVVIFFPHASAALDAPAEALVAGAARRAASDPSTLVTVAGYAAAHGDTDADAVLAGKRAQVVAALLEQDGVATSRISIVPRPPNNENPPVAARRVEITIGST